MRRSAVTLLIAAMVLSAFWLVSVPAADPPPPVTEDMVDVDECDSYYYKDAFSGKWCVSIKVWYKMVDGGVLTAGVYDDTNQEWYAADPITGISLEGNRQGFRTFTFEAAQGSALETQMKAGTPVKTFGRLVPNVQNPTPLVDECLLYKDQG